MYAEGVGPQGRRSGDMEGDTKKQTAVDEESLRRIESKEELKEVLSVLKEHLPVSAPVYNGVQLVLSGGKEHKVFTPKDRRHARKVFIISAEVPCYFTFFCEQENSWLLKRVLSETRELDFDGRQFRVNFIPEWAAEIVKDSLRCRSFGQRTPEFDCIGRFFYFDLETVVASSKNSSSDGVVLQLGKAGIGKCYETWFRRHVSGEEFRLLPSQYPRLGFYLHDHAVPSLDREEGNLKCGRHLDLDHGDNIDVPVGPDDQVPVSWTATRPEVMLGILQTQEEYRRRGYGSLVFMALARLLVARGLFPFFTTAPENERMLSFASKLQCVEGNKLVFLNALPRTE
ncbi:uncharacterized protein LOC143023677 isoform X2 [Oratosquilla oratoria]|uniref:uncharacterized protein LOC143023677 isoform X2 n=1 Tax=Oratosquilla oratoria TaxID=337810 RepID=UPI003F7702D9